jgi:hypothetical protein
MRCYNYQSSAVRYLLIISMAFASSGCGDGGDELGRVEVSGDVLIDGSPVTAGRVNFIPEGATKGPASGSPIDDGTFRISREHGPVPGKYLVRVQIDSGEPATSPDSPKPESRTRQPTKEEVLSGSREVTMEDEASSGEDFDPTLENEKVAEPSIPEFHVTVTTEGPNSFTLKVNAE